MPSRRFIVVVGSVNLDIVASVANLPVAGETVTGASLSRFPGGKGANQALAAKRLGANVALVARVGNDANADEAIALLLAGDVDLSACERDASAPTGVALITVSSCGENQIVVAPGANRELHANMIVLPEADAMICQLEVPVETLCHAVESFSGFISVNLAPALDVPDTLISCANLVVVNETEAEFYGRKLEVCTGLLATTFGAEGAVLTKAGVEVARSKPAVIVAVDTTGAGDTFTAALTLGIIEGMELQHALDFACAAGAIAATRAGAQPSLPYRQEVDAMLNWKYGG
ncbi:MAG: ribokinase [Proteobacteria bacterium]|nr:ribokinase [Pseudomonadota bacterium]MDA0993308.1 ribokinase [Pseudomonadota bacterium]